VAFVSIVIGSIALFVLILVSICCCCPCCWLAQRNKSKKMKTELEMMRIQNTIQRENIASFPHPPGVQGAPVSRAASPPPLSTSPAAVVVTETHIYPSTDFDDIEQAPQPHTQFKNPPPYEFVTERQQQNFSSRMGKVKDKTVDVVILAKDKTTGAVKSVAATFSKNKTQSEKKEPL